MNRHTRGAVKVPHIPRTGDISVRPVQYGMRDDTGETIDSQEILKDFRNDDISDHDLAFERSVRFEPVHRQGDYGREAAHFEPTARPTLREEHVNIGGGPQVEIKGRKFRSGNARKQTINAEPHVAMEYEEVEFRENVELRPKETRQKTVVFQYELDELEAQQRRETNLRVQPKSHRNDHVDINYIESDVHIPQPKLEKLMLDFRARYGREMTDRDIDILMRQASKPRKTNARSKTRVNQDIQETTMNSRAKNKERVRKAPNHEVNIEDDYQEVNGRPSNHKNSRHHDRAGRHRTSTRNHHRMQVDDQDVDVRHRASSKKKSSKQTKKHLPKDTEEITFVPISQLKQQNRPTKNKFRTPDSDKEELNVTGRSMRTKEKDVKSIRKDMDDDITFIPIGVKKEKPTEKRKSKPTSHTMDDVRELPVDAQKPEKNQTKQREHHTEVGFDDDDELQEKPKMRTKNRGKSNDRRKVPTNHETELKPENPKRINF